MGICLPPGPCGHKRSQPITSRLWGHFNLQLDGGQWGNLWVHRRMCLLVGPCTSWSIPGPWLWGAGAKLWAFSVSSVGLRSEGLRGMDERGTLVPGGAGLAAKRGGAGSWAASVSTARVKVGRAINWGTDGRDFCWVPWQVLLVTGPRPKGAVAECTWGPSCFQVCSQDYCWHICCLGIGLPSQTALPSLGFHQGLTVSYLEPKTPRAAFSV